MIRAFQLVYIFKGPSILSLQVSMQGMHIIEFRFEFESQLDFFFMGLHVLSEFLF